MSGDPVMNAARFKPPRAVPTLSPCFTMDQLDLVPDHSSIIAMQYLDEKGFVVIAGVANTEEVAKGVDLAWKFLEQLGLGIDRTDAATWDTPKWPDPFRKGILTADGVGQSEFLWYCRGLVNVQGIFKKVWDTEDLMTSFDGMCFHRPFEYNDNWKTSDGSWFHVDQNGHTKPDKLCVQGFLNFFESGVDDGGLIVVPGSHKIFKDIFASRPKLSKFGDFVPLSSDESVWNGEIKAAGLEPIKVCCGRGDFLLWDSRTIHCNEPARTARELPQEGALLTPRRLVAYVCMTPASRLTPEIRELRVKAYQDGNTTSHWPEDVFSPSVRMNKAEGYSPVLLSDGQKALIPL